MSEETLEQLYRQIFSEYEQLRDSDYNLNIRILQSLVQFPMAHEMSSRMKDKVSDARKASRYRGPNVKDAVDELTEECFIVAVSRGLEGRVFSYDELMPHEHVQNGYSEGYRSRMPLDTKFNKLREVTPDRIEKFFYFLGTVYERAQLDPIEMASFRLDKMRYLK